MLNLYDDETTTIRLWSLTEDALVEDDPDGNGLTVLTRWGEFDVRGADPVTVESLRRMGFGPVSLRNTLPGRVDRGGRSGESVDALEHVLDQIRCAVVHSLGLPDGQGPLLSVVPVVADPVFRPAPVPADRLVRLSRFSTMRPDAGVLLLDLPGTAFEVQLRLPPAQAIGAALVTPSTIGRLNTVTGLPVAVVADLVSFLTAAGVVLVADADSRFAEDDDPVWQGWNHHELLFHQHSRKRMGVAPRDVVLDAAAAEPPPVSRPTPAGRRIPLPRADLGTLATADATLTDLLETDHTCPRPDGEALTLDQIGHLLHRSSRVRSTGPAHIPMRGGLSYDASQRPYFSLGCLYELELYLTVSTCTGLDAGIYHYDPIAHELVLIDGDTDHVDHLVDLGKVGAGSVRRPAAMLTVTARMPRLSWVLGGASYATALVHSGALLETVYLVGKAEGVAAHPVVADGTGAIDDLLRLPWPAEVTVGDCVLDVKS